MKTLRKASIYVLPVAFLVLLFLPFLNGTMGIWEYERKDENRTFKDTVPTVDFSKLDDFPKEADLYFSDNFSFRSPLLDLYHNIKFSYFKISPHPDKTIVGNNGWFFMSLKEKEIYEGKHDFTKMQLDAFLNEWKKRTKYLDSLDIKTYWIIAPMKHYVYKDELPFNVYSPKGRRVDQLKKHFEADLPNLIFDPLSILLNNKDNKKLFYKLDNHWNFHSGYLTTQKLIEKIKVDIPNSNLTQMPGVDWLDTVIYSGFHHSVIGIPELNEIRQIPFVQNIASVESEKYGFPCVPNFAYPWEYEIRYTNKKTKSGLKILFIRDSFGGQMMPYIKEMFAESVFIFDAWRYQFNKPIIEAVKPDVIVYLGLETHLENMLKDYK